ncbi:4Fe-4S dicluster domain-containing protein [Fontivita pretiosa]|uniref:4Fe-4S dicluster domain-containing protein n=1 Tax=Fontivita pretiosa TaxID=2989684 RepID=UPI003D16D374
MDASSPWPPDPPTFAFLETSPWFAVPDMARLEPVREVRPTELGAWIDRLRRAGIVADRHNSPDLYRQLEQALRRPVDTILCNALDVDPEACLNSALAARYALELSAAMLLLSRLTHAEGAAVVVDRRVPSGWWARLAGACAAINTDLRPMVNDYPQADPTLLLYSLLDRRLRPGRLPTEQGVILLDAAAAVLIGREALLGEPMTHAPLAIRDHGLERSEYLVAPIGMAITELLDRLGLPWQGRLLRAGELLRDVRLSMQTLVGGGELVLHLSAPPPQINPAPCIRCGWCVDACPTRVHPAAALEAAQRHDTALAERAGIEACIECGICAYVCPSLLPLLEGVRFIRRMNQSFAAAPMVADE